MKILSLITEYNPFHNGHIYHIKKSKEIVNPDVTIAVMSGNYTQRGELAVTNKFIRGKAALDYVDLVVELPLLYAVSFADDFAYGGLLTSKQLGATHIVFGSESNDIESLKNAYLKSKSISKNDLAPLLSNGYSYPRAISELTNAPALKEPNNTLGMSYIKASDVLNYNVSLHTVKRVGNHYSDNKLSLSEFSSATSLRQTLLNGEIEKAIQFMPKLLAEKIISDGVVTNEVMFETLKVIIERSSIEDLKKIYTMTEGLEYRLKQQIINASSYEDFINKIKTKRYTRTRLQRLLLYVLLNITNEDYNNYTPEKFRILAMNQTGREYLSKIQDGSFITNVTKKDALDFYYEIKGTRIYNTLTNQRLNDFNQPVIIQST